MDLPYLNGFLGGCLIGAGSLLALAVTGKTPGISGVFGRLLRPGTNENGWRLIFLAGLIGGAALLFFTVESAAEFRIPGGRSWLVLTAAGLLVGFGTRLGGGCTSGHGVCGIGMRARHSMVATGIFMATAMLTVALFQKLITGS